MKDIRKKITNWRIEATSPRNDGWVSAHYKGLILEAYAEIKKTAEAVGVIDITQRELPPLIQGEDDD
jgi:hypothetical protein